MCDPHGWQPTGLLCPRILQAKILEWVAVSFSNACMCAKLLQSCPTLCNPMDSSHQAPLSTGFSRQEYWSRQCSLEKHKKVYLHHDTKHYCGRKWQPTPVFLPGKSHGWRSPVSYSPRGRKESDTTEPLHFTSNLHVCNVIHLFIISIKFSGFYHIPFTCPPKHLWWLCLPDSLNLTCKDEN